MHLLFVTPFYKPAYTYGGPTRSIPALAEGLASLGVEVTVYTTNANGKQNLPLDAGKPSYLDGVEVVYFNRDIPGSYFYTRQLGIACHRNANIFDAIYVASNWAYPLIPACKSAGNAKRPYIITPRTSFMQKTWKGKFLKKWVYHYGIERRLINRAAAVHYTSDLECHESTWLNLRPSSFIVPNPVDIREFAHLPQRGTFREAHHISLGEKIILYLGRIEARKGLDLTLSAFAQIASDFPTSRLVLAGPDEDNYSVTLRELAAQLGIAERVQFTGYLNSHQRLEAYADSDIFILSSRSENFGMAVVEAMACGLPVIVSDLVGLAPVIKNDSAGLVTPLTPDDITAAIRALLQDEQLCKQFGYKGIQVAYERFAPKAVAQQMLQAFETTLESKLGK